jgi:hypothetical protein
MNEREQDRLPKTYHTPRADAIYEQCIWDREHVEAIYPKLANAIADDGQWHDIPLEEGKVGRYRVFGNQYFQAVFAGTANEVFDALTSMDPVETEDDAEWAVWQIDEGSYALSSTFAMTPGQFEHQPEVDAWLWRHGLGLEPNPYSVEGVAYFTAITSASMTDAVGRLTWLEQAFAELGTRLDQAGREFWHELQAESDAIVEKLEASVEPSLIVPLPQRYRRPGPKYREALSPSDAGT